MKKNIYTPIVAFVLGLSLSSCDKFLDEVPDKRTELDSAPKKYKNSWLLPILMPCMRNFVKQ